MFWFWFCSFFRSINVFLRCYLWHENREVRCLEEWDFGILIYPFVYCLEILSWCCRGLYLLLNCDKLNVRILTHGGQVINRWPTLHARGLCLFVSFSNKPSVYELDAIYTFWAHSSGERRLIPVLLVPRCIIWIFT